jgi:glycosyltransferase involved in cell wall biosynthesis
VAIVHVAVLRPEKGHDVLLRAARRVVDACGHARFLLVGEGPRRAEIERQIDELGLRANVRLLGQRHDVERILAAGDVAVLASRDRVETFPNSILEAMSSGLPCVCTRVGSLDEMIDDGVEGLLVPPEDSVKLADALTHLARDPSLRRSFGTHARARVERDFPHELMIRTREQLFLQLVADATLRRRKKLEG